jgi:transposase
MMGKKRRVYTADFKLETLALCESGERSRAEVERELGLPRGIITGWKQAAEQNGAEAFPGHGKLKPGDEAVRSLERRNVELEQELSILKKALGILAQPNRSGSW